MKLEVAKELTDNLEKWINSHKEKHTPSTISFLLISMGTGIAMDHSNSFKKAKKFVLNIVDYIFEKVIEKEPS